jgi:hypothetical protein
MEKKPCQSANFSLILGSSAQLATAQLATKLSLLLKW